MDKAKSTEFYKKTFLLVKEVLNQYDPMCLKPGHQDGCPEDEYESEVVPIVAFLIKNLKSLETNEQALATEIDRVWIEFFDDKSGCSLDIANEILKRINEQGKK